MQEEGGYVLATDVCDVVVGEVNVADGFVQDKAFHDLLCAFVANVAAADVDSDQREVLFKQRHEMQAAV